MQFANADEAKAAATQRGRGFHVVGLTPWFPAFPVAAVTGLRQVAEFRDAAQKAGESPMVRIFEVASNQSQNCHASAGLNRPRCIRHSTSSMSSYLFRA